MKSNSRRSFLRWRAQCSVALQIHRDANNGPRRQTWAGQRVLDSTRGAAEAPRQRLKKIVSFHCAPKNKARPLPHGRFFESDKLQSAHICFLDSLRVACGKHTFTFSLASVVFCVSVLQVDAPSFRAKRMFNLRHFAAARMNGNRNRLTS